MSKHPPGKLHDGAVDLQVRKDYDHHGRIHIQGAGVETNRPYGVADDIEATPQIIVWVNGQKTNRYSLAGGKAEYVAADMRTYADGKLYLRIYGEKLNRGYGALIRVEGKTPLKAFYDKQKGKPQPEPKTAPGEPQGPPGGPKKSFVFPDFVKQDPDWLELTQEEKEQFQKDQKKEKGYTYIEVNGSPVKKCTYLAPVKALTAADLQDFLDHHFGEGPHYGNVDPYEEVSDTPNTSLLGFLHYIKNANNFMWVHKLPAVGSLKVQVGNEVCQVAGNTYPKEIYKLEIGKISMPIREDLLQHHFQLDEYALQMAPQMDDWGTFVTVKDSLEFMRDEHDYDWVNPLPDHEIVTNSEKSSVKKVITGGIEHPAWYYAAYITTLPTAVIDDFFFHHFKAPIVGKTKKILEDTQSQGHNVRLYEFLRDVQEKLHLVWAESLPEDVEKIEAPPLGLNDVVEIGGKAYDKSVYWTQLRFLTENLIREFFKHHFGVEMPKEGKAEKALEAILEGDASKLITLKSYLIGAKQEFGLKWCNLPPADPKSKTSTSGKPLFDGTDKLKLEGEILAEFEPVAVGKTEYPAHLYLWRLDELALDVVRDFAKHHYGINMDHGSYSLNAFQWLRDNKPETTLLEFLGELQYAPMEPLPEVVQEEAYPY